MGASWRSYKKSWERIMARVPECKGAFGIEIERPEDRRGFFARTFCQREFAQHGLESTVAQAKVAFNHNISRCLVKTAPVANM
jgi:dTDP-4-dehydrorhamnose 3,5-epimerase-like enzyme